MPTKTRGPLGSGQCALSAEFEESCTEQLSTGKQGGGPATKRCERNSSVNRRPVLGCYGREGRTKNSKEILKKKCLFGT